MRKDLDRRSNTKHSSESTRTRLQRKLAERKTKAADEPEQGPSPMYSMTLGVARLQQQTNVATDVIQVIDDTQNCGDERAYYDEIIDHLSPNRLMLKAVEPGAGKSTVCKLMATNVDQAIQYRELYSAFDRAFSQGSA